MFHRFDSFFISKTKFFSLWAEWLELRATLSALEANRSAVSINFTFLVFQLTLKRMKSLFKVLSQTSGRQTLRLHHFHDIETPAVDILSDGSWSFTQNRFFGYYIVTEINSKMGLNRLRFFKSWGSLSMKNHQKFPKQMP